MPEEKKKKYKSVEEVRADITQKFNTLEMQPAARKPILDLVLEENRQAWIRGKEYGWHKAWNWKRKSEAQSA